MKALVLIAALILFSNASYAQHGRDIVTGPHDGKMQEIADVEVELLVSEREVTLCLCRQNAPIDTSNYKAIVTVVSGASREQIVLRPTTAGRLGGSSTSALRPYSVLSLELTSPSGTTGTIRF